MIYTIKGCLVKYNVPWYDDTVILAGAFDESDGKIVPVAKSFGFSTNNVVGSAELSTKDDGIYYVCTLNESADAEDILYKIMHYNWQIGLFANKIEKDDKLIKKGSIVGIAMHAKCDNASSILEINVDQADATTNCFEILDKTVPCPFCGAKPKIIYELEDRCQARVEIFCPKCNASIDRCKPFKTYSVNGANPGYAFINAEREAIAAWSKRFVQAGEKDENG